MERLIKNSKMLAEDYELLNIDHHSNCDEYVYNQQHNLPLRRQGAIDIYNYDKCEFLILEKIQAFMCNSKDKINLFYYRIERSKFMQKDNILRYFGYKCKMVRDLTNPS